METDDEEQSMHFGKSVGATSELLLEEVSVLIDETAAGLGINAAIFNIFEVNIVSRASLQWLPVAMR